VLVPFRGGRVAARSRRRDGRRIGRAH
jgi:hypothetical protein